MKESRVGAWLALLIGTIYFVVPLIGTFEFSLRMRRGVYSFDAYRVVLADPRFQASFGYSTVLAIATILVGVLLVVPTAYWVQLRLPRLRPIVEFITLLPLVIPAIVLVFGYLRIYNSSSWLPLTAHERTTDLLLTFSYVTLS
ncbi:MAG TPA: ABC transporter permease, partial [Dongiaceae bacterium]|nr:ABC transporter permease [Dongiaceae bacterium]